MPFGPPPGLDRTVVVPSGATRVRRPAAISTSRTPPPSGRNTGPSGNRNPLARIRNPAASLSPMPFHSPCWNG